MFRQRLISRCSECKIVSLLKKANAWSFHSQVLSYALNISFFLEYWLNSVS